MASASSSEHDRDKHPSITVDSVIEAIQTLKEPKGCTLTSLKKYIVSNSSEQLKGNEVARLLKQVITRGVKDGQLSRIGRNKFTISTEDEEGSKKSRRRRKDDDDDLRPRRRRRSRRRRSRRRRRRSRRRRSRRRRSRRRRRRSRRRRRRSRRRRRRSRRRRRR